MKPLLILLLCVILVLPLFDAVGQVSNLVVNGSTTHFTMTSGDTIRWEFDLPAGDAAELNFWFDVNHDGVVQPGTDKLFAAFTQLDGGEGFNGPPDLDNLANGHIVFFQPVGLAPADYILRFTHNAVTAQVTGTVQPLVAIAHTISGRVTPPPGESAAFIVVEIQRDVEGGLSFWDGITDVNGDYAIHMDSDTAGNPWYLYINTEFPPAIVTPGGIEITVTGNHPGNDFTFDAPAAQVCGTLRNESGVPMPAREVYIYGSTTMSDRWTQTDANGRFRIGVTDSDLINPYWYLGVSMNGDTTTTELRTTRNVPGLQAGDSLYYDLISYSVNSQITGTLLVNGAPPGFRIQVMAQSGDSVQGSVYCDASSGAFVLGVSTLISQYNLFPVNLPWNYSTQTVIGHPGDAGLVLPVTVTSVRETPAGIPATFSLHQNYPNPFNPATTITFDLAERSEVHLRIFNLLGQEVATLVDGVREAGFKSVEWNAGAQTSGLYFCRLDGSTLSGPARHFSFVTKLLLTK
jgi:hypothetical protein